VSGGSDQLLKLWDLSVLKSPNPPKKIYPLLNVFVATNNEYVAWTKEGFFTASKGGAKYIGYHINQGENNAAEFVSVDKFYDTFYRPDLIAKAIKGEDLSVYAQTISIDDILKTGLAPRVAINTRSHLSKSRDVSISLKICEKDGGYNNATLFLNAVAIDTHKIKNRSRGSKTECFDFTKRNISLINGANVFSFKATNRDGTMDSNTATITLDYQGVSRSKPDLHILALGINNYRDGSLRLNYSVADAKGFVKTLTTVATPLFANIYPYQMLDSQVTKENVFAKFKEISTKAKPNDVFMFYIAGHGTVDAKTSTYFYLPYDFRYTKENSVRKKGISQKDFTQALSKIPALKSLVLIDTCNSGGFTDTPTNRGMLEKLAINKLTRATGRSTIMASSKDQVALEGYQGHGVFTYTLIEALKGKGYGVDKQITIKELAAYIEDILPDRAYQKWGYEQVPQSNMTGTDFPIGIKMPQLIK